MHSRQSDGGHSTRSWSSV